MTRWIVLRSLTIKQQSSLSLQIILYLHGLFLRVWFFATLILLAWKRLVLKFILSPSSINWKKKKNLFLHRKLLHNRFCLKRRHRFFYPVHAFRWEIAIVVLLTFIDATRQALASRGNKTEELKPILWSVGLTFPVVIGYTFFLHLQTYV